MKQVCETIYIIGGLQAVSRQVFVRIQQLALTGGDSEVCRSNSFWAAFLLVSWPFKLPKHPLNVLLGLEACIDTDEAANSQAKQYVEKQFTGRADPLPVYSRPWKSHSKAMTSHGFIMSVQVDAHWRTQRKHGVLLQTACFIIFKSLSVMNCYDAPYKL